MELRIREYLRGKELLNPLLNVTLVKVDAFASSILAEGIDPTLKRVLGRGVFRSAMHLIQKIGEKLSEDAEGITRDLLSKSVQETLFYCVGTDPDLRPSQFRSRLRRYLDDHGTSALTHRFVSLCFFNFVWFQTGESFRTAASTPNSFERDLEDVEQTCRRIVASTWITMNLMQRPIDVPTATELISTLDQRLRGETATWSNSAQ